MLKPFTRFIDLADGPITPDSRLIQRRLADMKGAYAADCDGAELVYEVFNVDVPEKNSELQTCTTRLHHGKVGDEYFMTKGHFHEIRDRSEVYLTTAGQGRLIMADRGRGMGCRGDEPELDELHSRRLVASLGQRG